MPYIQQVLQHINIIEPNSGRRPALVRIIKTPMKLASIILRISFLLSCRNAGVIPNFILNATVTVPKIFGGNPTIMKECVDFRKKLLNESIRDAFRTKAFLERCQRRDRLELNSCGQRLFLWIKKACKDVFEDTLSAGRQRLKKKFDRLTAVQLNGNTKNSATSVTRDNRDDRDITAKRERVNNLSSQPISNTMHALLSKGPKFALTPSVNNALLLDVETGIERFAYGKRWKDFVDRKRTPANHNLNTAVEMHHRQPSEEPPRLAILPAEEQSTDGDTEQLHLPTETNSRVTRSCTRRESQAQAESDPMPPRPAQIFHRVAVGEGGNAEPHPSQSQLETENRSTDSEPQSAPASKGICANFPDITKRQPPRSTTETETKLQQLKKKIISVYKNHTPLNVNTTEEERQELRKLKESDSLIVKPSDKCKGLVILNKTDYVEKAKEILQDEQSYEKMNKNPTAKIEAKTKQVFKQTCRDKLPETLLKDLTPAHSRTPVLYGLPKDHKDSVPLRPIVSACGGPTEKTSWLLEKILTQLLPFIPAHLRNTEDYLNRLNSQYKDHQLPQNAIVFSMDVVNLYGSIPINEAVEAVKDLIEE